MAAAASACVVECMPANDGEAKAAAAAAEAKEDAAPPVGDGADSDDGRVAKGDISGSGMPVCK